MQILEQVPDGIKVAGAVAAPVLTFVGIPVEQWTYILSALVSIAFLLEKLPMIIARIRTFIRWMKSLKKD